LNKTLFIVAILISNFDFAQNLVPNPSFEIYDTCPSSESQPNNFQLQHALGWQIPTLATSDYFNVCNITNVSAPSNFMGYQPPYDGVAYAGILLLIEENEPSWTEYIQIKTSEPLKKGSKYNFSFNINHSNISDYAIRKIGAWFTPNAVSSNNTTSLFSSLPQIENTTGFLNDSVSWTKIEGDFIANGGEEYLTIGYFIDTNNIDTLRTSIFADPTAIFSYYYIDGIGLNEVTPEIVIPNIITPNNDGTNDVFQLNFPYENVIIYNRWGQKLFESYNDDSFWSGKTKSGTEVRNGTYFYLITTEKEIFKGFVQVVR